jgi:hypothetical protein
VSWTFSDYGERMRIVWRHFEKLLHPKTQRHYHAPTALSFLTPQLAHVGFQYSPSSAISKIALSATEERLIWRLVRRFASPSPTVATTESA